MWHLEARLHAVVCQGMRDPCVKRKIFIARLYLRVRIMQYVMKQQMGIRAPVTLDIQELTVPYSPIVFPRFRKHMLMLKQQEIKILSYLLSHRV